MATETKLPQLDLVSLMRAHQADVWRYLRFLGCDSFLAEDLTQETFLAILRRPFEYRGRAAAAAYLRFVARNLYVSSRRHAPSDLPYGTLEDAEEAWGHSTPDEDSDRRLEELRFCLSRLDPRARQALDLRYAQEQSSLEIASALGTTSDGARSLLKRARDELQACLKFRMRKDR